GLPAAQRALKPNETWFAVFMRVQNTSTETAHQASDLFEIRDTLNKTFSPLSPAPDNVFAYRARNVPPKGVIPFPDSTAAQGDIQGSLLLFKIPYANLENRPLQLFITSPKDSSDVGR